MGGVGSIVLETGGVGGSAYVPVSVFSQTNVTERKVYYEHGKSGANSDRIPLIATSK